MAPRLSKRQQREQEELLALATHPSPNTDLHESTEEESVAPAKTGFAALLTPEDQQGVAESEDENTTKPAKSRKTKKRKKKAAGPVHDKDGPPAGMPVTPRPQVTSRSKPATKKVKAQDKKEEKDDLDKALAELSIKYPDLQQIAPSASTDTRATKLSTLFSVSVSHLDAESELKKFFGSKAVSAAQAATSTSSPKRRRGVQPQTQRSQLARPQPSWGMMKPREGLSARPLTEEETTRKVNNGPTGTGKWWTVEYTKRYKGVTKTFMQAVMTGDPETLWRVLQRMPWHADTLLQLAEVYRHREEYSQAVDYVSRALYAYERAFLGAFSFTSGNNRLDFDRVENRPFFLAIHRQVIDLQRCGCPRTAFEHARLLISLEPLSDPHGVYLHLDYLCVKAGMGDWLLDTWSVYQSKPHEHSGEHVDPTVLPGWSYARALILRAKEKEKKERGEDFKEESTEALRQAILAFPMIVPLLADKCEISLSAEVRGHKAPRIHTDGMRVHGLSPEESILHLLAHLYAQRSSPLWKSSGNASWLSSTSNALLSDTFYPARTPCPRTIPVHLLVPHLACDPLPPPSAISTYDATFFAGSEDTFALGATRLRRRTQAEERLLTRLIPDAATRAQILAFYDQNPWIAAQVPGGVVEFVQMMAEAPDDALHELMIAAEMMREGGGNVEVQPGLADRGAMPGELLDEENEVFWEAEDDVDDVPHGQPGHQEEDEEDEDEDDEDVAPMPIRVVRNLLNRLWGGAPAQEYEDSSDDDGANNG
ncbi:transcriptional repressor TCF25-domain-containing protein [Boletus edulis]|nr:transcriptional repressor TCF25-domain-containing protein [Boletus edulis]